MFVLELNQAVLLESVCLRQIPNAASKTVCCFSAISVVVPILDELSNPTTCVRLHFCPLHNFIVSHQTFSGVELTSLIEARVPFFTNVDLSTTYQIKGFCKSFEFQLAVQSLTLQTLFSFEGVFSRNPKSILCLLKSVWTLFLLQLSRWRILRKPFNPLQQQVQHLPKAATTPSSRIWF